MDQEQFVCSEPRFSKVMLCGDTLAVGLTKEGFHQFWRFLNTVQGAKCQPLHFALGLRLFARNLLPDLGPNLLVRVNAWANIHQMKV